MTRPIVLPGYGPSVGGEHGTRGPERQLVKGKLRQVRPRGGVLRFQLNPSQVTPDGGVGGWARRQRPGLPPALEWEGVPEQTLAFTLLLDGWDRERSVEPDIRLLKQMGRPRARKRPPPELELEYGGTGHGTTWVIDSLSWGEELRNGQLARIRQEVSVVLLEYVEADVTLTPADRHKENKGGNRDEGGGGSGGGNRTASARAGDTLAAVAARELGSAARWPELADLNGLRDPSRVTTGQTLRLPEA